MRTLAEEKGVALVLALFALVVLGGLAAAGFVLGLTESKVGRALVAREQAFHAADAGATLLLVAWNPAYENLAVGDSAPASPRWLPDSSAWYEASVLRLSPRYFLIRAIGHSRDGSANQPVGLFVRSSVVRGCSSEPGPGGLVGAEMCAPGGAFSGIPRVAPLGERGWLNVR